MLDSDGSPAVVYYDELLSGIKYRRATDTDGTAWSELLVISVAAASIFSAGVVDGRPAVIFLDRIDDKMRLVVANDAKGTVWGFPSEVSLYPSAEGSAISPQDSPLPLLDVNGLPAFTYSANYTNEDEARETHLHYVAYY